MQDARPLLENIERLTEFIITAPVYRSFVDENWLKKKENLLAVHTLEKAVAEGEVEGKLQADSGLVQCYRMGLLQAEQGLNDVVYVMPTRLHHKYYEHFLCQQDTFPEKYSTLEDLLCDAITHLSRQALTGVERKLGPGLLYLPREATFQHELYRGIWKALKGIFTISDWSGEGSRGRIDLVVVAGNVRWGIECVRNGQSMAEHIRRFLPGGIYHPWISEKLLHTYAIVDFRFAEPRTYCSSSPHPDPDPQADGCRADHEYPWIYYVIFSTDCTSARLLNHKGGTIKEEFRILN
jgi:hypothetical protein